MRETGGITWQSSSLDMLQHHVDWFCLAHMRPQAWGNTMSANLAGGGTLSHSTMVSSTCRMITTTAHQATSTWTCAQLAILKA